MSQLLFIVAIDPLIRELALKYGEKNIVAYCDDIIIAKKGPGPSEPRGARDLNTAFT